MEEKDLTWLAHRASKNRKTKVGNLSDDSYLLKAQKGRKQKINDNITFVRAK